MYRTVVTICTTSRNYMYRQFNVQQFHVLPTQCIYVLCGSQNKQQLTGYYNRDGECLLRGTDWSCKHSVFLSPLDPKVPARHSSQLPLHFPKAIITAIGCLAPFIDCSPPRHAANDTTLTDRWNRAYRSGGGRHLT